MGDPLVICGAGPIGMVTLLSAHAAGAAPIVITDLDESRLTMAKSLVPRVRTVLVQKGEEPQTIGERIKEVLEREAKLVIECTGIESSIHAGIYVSRHISTFNRSNQVAKHRSCRRLQHLVVQCSSSVLERIDRRYVGRMIDLCTKILIQSDSVHVCQLSRDRHSISVSVCIEGIFLRW